MIKLILWIDDGREEVVTMTTSAVRAEESQPARPLSWELLHQNFVERLREKEKEG